MRRLGNEGASAFPGPKVGCHHESVGNLVHEDPRSRSKEGVELEESRYERSAVKPPKEEVDSQELAATQDILPSHGLLERKKAKWRTKGIL